MKFNIFSRRLIRQSFKRNSWEEWFSEGKSLKNPELNRALDEIDELRDQIGKSFGHWDKSDLKTVSEILDNVSDNDYEVYSYIQDLEEYFSFY